MHIKIVYMFLVYDIYQDNLGLYLQLWCISLSMAIYILHTYIHILFFKTKDKIKWLWLLKIIAYNNHKDDTLTGNLL